MKSIITSSIAATTTEFDSLTLFENKVILRNKKKEETTLLSSDLAKIYIRKYNFNFATKLGFVVSLLFLFSFSILFLPSELVLFVFLGLFFPLFIWINTYKWYQLNVLHNNGTFFRKVFYKSTKQEYIELVNKVRKNIFENHIKSNNQIINSFDKTPVNEENQFKVLSIA